MLQTKYLLNVLMFSKLKASRMELKPYHFF